MNYDDAQRQCGADRFEPLSRELGWAGLGSMNNKKGAKGLIIVGLHGAHERGVVTAAA